jgi:Tfp pilus assembly protein PilF
MRNVFLLAIAVLLLNACAVHAPQPSSSGPVPVLMAQADQFVVAGDNRQAIALLERAVRIEPRNGHAWLRLARLHLASGESNKAEQFARRAMQFAASDKRLQQECQEFIGKLR